MEIKGDTTRYNGDTISFNAIEWDVCIDIYIYTVCITLTHTLKKKKTGYDK